MKALFISLVASVAACAANAPAEPAAKAATPYGPIEEVSARADYVEPDDRTEAATPAGDAQRRPSGLMSKVILPGSGTAHPRGASVVRVHYVGWTSDGRVFDSSRQRGQPAEFGLDKVIPGWTEGVPLMVVGEVRRFWIPADLAYGNDPTSGRPTGQLTFDIELLAIISTPDIPDTPADVASAPADATRLPSGLAYKVLIPGTGEHPDADDFVSIDYTGWTPSGMMFDSTFTNNHGPTTFELGHGVKGWVEGIQLMRQGETALFWLPAKLMFGDNPPHGQPKGDVVFEIHLVRIGKD